MAKPKTGQQASQKEVPPNPFAAAGELFAANPFASAFTPPLDVFANGGGQAMRAWTQMNRAVLEGVGRMQQEASRFVVQRLEDDLERQRRILACRSPEDAWQICAEGARKAVQDYTDEASRLSEIAAEVQYACSGFGEMLASSAVPAATAEDAPKAEKGRKSAA